MTEELRGYAWTEWLAEACEETTVMNNDHAKYGDKVTVYGGGLPFDVIDVDSQGWVKVVKWVHPVNYEIVREEP